MKYFITVIYLLLILNIYKLSDYEKLKKVRFSVKMKEAFRLINYAKSEIDDFFLEIGTKVDDLNNYVTRSLILKNKKSFDII